MWQFTLNSEDQSRELRVLAVDLKDGRSRRTNINSGAAQQSLTRARRRLQAVGEWVGQIRNEGQTVIIRWHEGRRTGEARL